MPCAAPGLITKGEFAQAFPLLICRREINEKDAFVFVYERQQQMRPKIDFSI
jgi:hypothetical protein